MRDSAYHPRRGKPRFDDDEPSFAKRNRHRDALVSLDDIDATDGVAAGDRWSTWDQSAPAQRGPRPHPDWLVTELAATDTELGILKTGKEADVFLLQRAVPGTDRSCLLAAKRYRSAEHRLFHRDSEYLEGRRVRESRDSRAMANRTAVGRQMIAVQWADAEFSALCQLHLAGVPVPYPVQVLGTELLHGIHRRAGRRCRSPPGGDAGAAALSLPGSGSSWSRPCACWPVLGWRTATCRPITCWSTREQLVMIDTPQVVDVIANPRGGEYLDRDAGNVGRWFAAHDLSGIGAGTPGPDELAAVLRSEARLSPG